MAILEKIKNILFGTVGPKADILHPKVAILHLNFGSITISSNVDRIQFGNFSAHFNFMVK